MMIIVTVNIILFAVINISYWYDRIQNYLQAFGLFISFDSIKEGSHSAGAGLQGALRNRVDSGVRGDVFGGPLYLMHHCITQR